MLAGCEVSPQITKKETLSRASRYSKSKRPQSKRSHCPGTYALISSWWFPPGLRGCGGQSGMAVIDPRSFCTRPAGAGSRILTRCLVGLTKGPMLKEGSYNNDELQAPTEPTERMQIPPPTKSLFFLALFWPLRRTACDPEVPQFRLPLPATKSPFALVFWEIVMASLLLLFQLLPHWLATTSLVSKGRKSHFWSIGSPRQATSLACLKRWDLMCYMYILLMQFWDKS